MVHKWSTNGPKGAQLHSYSRKKKLNARNEILFHICQAGKSTKFLQYQVFSRVYNIGFQYHLHIKINLEALKDGVCRMAKATWGKMNKGGIISLLDFKIYYKAIVKAAWYRHKDRHMEKN